MRSSRRRVLVVSQIYPPDLAGSATRALNVAKGLRANDVTATVVAAVPHYPDGRIPKKYRWRPLAVEYQDGIRVVRTFVPPLQSKGFGRRLILFGAFMVSSLFALPVVRNTDAVFASNPQTLVAFPGFVYSRILRCPLILNADDLWPESLYDLGMLKSKLGRSLGDLVAKVAYALADLITPISAGYVETLVGKYKVDPKRIEVIPGGVDLRLFGMKRAGERETFDVMYIGAFSMAYDFDQVLRAAQALSDRSGIRFVFQGSGELAPHIKSVVRSMNLRNVIVYDTVVSREEAARMMLQSDVLLVPLSGAGNIERGFSSKIYEYQAAAKPIVCCSMGMAGKYVLETKSGLVVDPGDSEGLARAIEQLYVNREAGLAMGARGRTAVTANYSIEAIGGRMLRLVESPRSGPAV